MKLGKLLRETPKDREPQRIYFANTVLHNIGLVVLGECYNTSCGDRRIRRIALGGLLSYEQDQ